MQTNLNTSSNKILGLHLFFTVVVAAILYFWQGKFFAASFFAFSAVFNLYLRLLRASFWLALAAKLKLEVENKTLLIIFSSLRAFLVAALVVFLVIKLKFNLMALVLAFICYNIITIAGGILLAKNQ